MTPANEYWHPQPAVEDHVCGLCAGALVVDVGANQTHRFSLATETVGWEGDRQIDFSRDRLPYKPLTVDFLHCRHTLEDLADPTLLLSEISRTARAGYIECPSPLVELSRGVDAVVNTHRGYRHHRWIAWSADGVLNLLPKYPLVEVMPDWEGMCSLVGEPQLWNTHHAWTGELKWKVWQHEVDFHLQRLNQRNGLWVSLEYDFLLHQAIWEGIASGEMFWNQLLQPQEN
jgi:hypothetical protein